MGVKKVSLPGRVFILLSLLFMVVGGCTDKNVDNPSIGDVGFWDSGVTADDIRAEDINDDQEDVDAALNFTLELVEEEVVLAYPRQQMQLHVRVVNKKGDVVDRPLLRWESSHNHVVRVVDGEVSSVSVGEAMITVYWEDMSASVRVNVKKIGWIEIEPGGREVLAGEQIQLQVRYFAADGDELYPPNAAVQWTANAPKVAIISPEGLLSIIAGGTVKVQARSEYLLAEETFFVDVRYSDISCELAHCCMVSTLNHLYCWGKSVIAQSSPWDTPYVEHYPTRVETSVLFKTIRMAIYGVCALDLEGSPWCWGTERFGRLGTGQVAGDVVLPQKISTDVRFVDMVLQPSGTYFLDEDGALHALGMWPPAAEYREGILSEVYFEPTLVDAGPWVGIADVQEGTLCLYNIEGVFCIGKNYDFNLGQGEDAVSYYDRFIQWGADVGILSVAGLGVGAMCGLDESGQVWCAGKNNVNGILGHVRDNSSFDDSWGPHHYIPTRTSWSDSFDKLHMGGSFVCGEKDGVLGCWGADFGCQLGWSPEWPGHLENHHYSYIPVWPKLPPFKKASLAYSDGCILDESGRLMCWGLTTDPSLYGLYNGADIQASGCEQRVVPVTAYERPGM